MNLTQLNDTMATNSSEVPKNKTKKSKALSKYKRNSDGVKLS